MLWLMCAVCCELNFPSHEKQFRFYEDVRNFLFKKNYKVVCFGFLKIVFA